jgi:hypothetical protein
MTLVAIDRSISIFLLNFELNIQGYFRLHKNKTPMRLEIFPVYLVVATVLLSGCAKSAASNEEPCAIEADSVAIASKQLTLSDAEKIMGEPAMLSCNTFTQRGSLPQYQCTYTALSEDDRTGKTGKLYYMSEVYVAEEVARAAYAEIYNANSGHEGVEIVSGLGNEAYYHSDDENFYFFLVRKNKSMFRLKLNKVTSHSSVESFKEVARLIVDRL